MKKRFLAVLFLTLILMLTACGSQTEKVEQQLQGTEKVEQQLQGRWEVTMQGEIGDTVARFKFNDGNFSCETIILGMSLGVTDGTYEITDSAILLNYSNGVNSELPYEYSSGELTLYFDSDQVLTKK